jgi:hypothetical protein
MDPSIIYLKMKLLIFLIALFLFTTAITHKTGSHHSQVNAEDFKAFAKECLGYAAINEVLQQLQTANDSFNTLT